MSAAPQTTQEEDTSARDAVRAIIFLLALVLALGVVTYFVGFGVLLAVAIVGSFVMLGILIYLSSPNQTV